MELKRIYCYKWGVQIIDCRYHPLNSIYDNYNPKKIKGQTKKDYYIHPKWTDSKIRNFRKNVRRHNICIRQNVNFHSSLLERKKVPINNFSEYKKMEYSCVKKLLPDLWVPESYHLSKEIMIKK